MASVAAQTATALPTIDAALADLRQGAQQLVTCSIDERMRLIDACIGSIGQVSRTWVEQACAAKGIPPNRPASAEEILGGPCGVVRYLQLLRATFDDIRHSGVPRLPARPQSLHGQQRVPIFPTRSLYDRLLFKPITVETWLQPGVSQDHLFGDQLRLLTGGRQPKIVTVLGAGNVASIPATDALTKILQDNCAVLLKMNPVNDYLGPLLEVAFASLIQAGFLRIIYGAADVGRYAIEHGDVDEVHITGSNRTHDAIVWGADPAERDRRRQSNDPLLEKPITSELGNVTPWIIVPGDYSQAQLRFQAENIAASIANNASFNCVATKMLVTWRDWPDRDRLLDLIEQTLANIPRRHAYYPGAQDRFAQFSGQSPPGDEPDVLPWTIRRNLNPDESPRMFEEESFVCVTGETALAANSPEAFLNASVDFVNERLWGTLAAAVTVPRGLAAEPLDAAVRRLRYGTVGINQWPGVSFGLMSPAWGAYPGSRLQDVQSGVGEVHNTYLLDRPEKTVLRSPLTMSPKPVWFSTHRNPQAVAWKLLDLYLRPGIARLPSLLYQAVRG